MKIRLWSDIHTEFGELKFTPRDDDHETVLVIAGDFQVGDRSFDVLRELSTKFRAILYTCGNHEYYGEVVQKLHRRFMDLSDELPNFYFLNPGIAIIDGVRFIGATLWTDMKLGDPIIKQCLQFGINDFRKAKWEYAPDSINKIVPNVVCRINAQHRVFINNELNIPFKGKTVVFTHHPPTMESHARSKYGGQDEDPIMYYYGNTKNEEVVAKADYWFHGHIHEWMDYMHEGCRIIARPRGYIGHEPTAYQYDLTNKDADIIEI